MNSSSTTRTTHACRLHSINLTLPALVLLLLAIVVPAVAETGNDNRAPNLGDCEDLEVPEGNKVAHHLYAEKRYPPRALVFSLG